MSLDPTHLAVHPPRHGQPFENNPALTIADMAQEFEITTKLVRLVIAKQHVQPAYRRDGQPHYWVSDFVVADRTNRAACQSRFLGRVARHARECA